MKVHIITDGYVFGAFADKAIALEKRGRQTDLHVIEVTINEETTDEDTKGTCQ